MNTLLRALARRFMRLAFPSVRQCSPGQLAAWLADTSRPQPLLLDVRTPAEFAASHLTGARRVDADCPAAELLPSLPPDQPIVCYCAAGWRSSLLARRLVRAGRKEVFNLEGAIFDWVCEGRPLERNGQPAREVHPFNWIGRLMLPRSLRASAPSPHH